MRWNAPRTPESLAQNRIGNRRRYAERIENGLCVRCGAPALEGRTMCENHMLKRRKYKRVYMRVYRRRPTVVEKLELDRQKAEREEGGGAMSTLSDHVQAAQGCYSITSREEA